MSLKQSIAIILLILSGIISDVGAADIGWISKDYDFGEIKEAEGKVRGLSQFVNVGCDTIAIVDARTKCTCTYVKYPHEVLAPGDTATVRYTFNPEGRRGEIDRSVRLVFSDGTTALIRLRGKVE